ncbi:L,D-transpeptidase family protein [Geomonas sp. Red69]|uniref:L,D-transpeptidase family protein n=1 Tax=Geomonas diazotrophica TaxID=2843197 RepID=A0ABX8JDH6_9BACT|nr:MULTISPECIES: L,D-transpeptidase family protein [Geomonas]MBU5636867.1 L,D-transpeptidase family protein [Geomonas diazotrophica]QWV96440.1 L,D-transpeptidase family protein [Geomonas nitrogeniifigens]
MKALPCMLNGPFLGFALLFALVACSPVSTRASDIVFHEGLGGGLQTTTTGSDDSLPEIARAHDIGYNAITGANPALDPFLPDSGSTVLLPTSWLLPDVAAHSGIVINLAEMRLYLFSERERDRVATYPVGIGDEGWDTPLGTYRVIEKIENPAWHVPASIRAQKPELPAVVPPGPNNPLGTRALRLSIGTVLIHGTDRPFGIGMRVSHGCIHLYPEDILELFKRVPIGTRVVIVNQPVKVALVGGRVLVEVHENGVATQAQQAWQLLERKGIANLVGPEKFHAALISHSGVVTDVTK